jgi:hypothetical protein
MRRAGRGYPGVPRTAISRHGNGDSSFVCIQLSSKVELAYHFGAMWEAFVKLASPTNPDEFWEMVTAMITIVLAAVAWRGLRSLNLTKKDMLIRSEREARHCAIARSEELAKVIIPANRALSAKLGEAQIPVFVKSAEEVSFDQNKTDHLPKVNQWIAKLPGPLHNDCIVHLNVLEGWAMYFTNGIADETIAFGPCAPVFCSQVAQYYPVLVGQRFNQRSGKYPNTIKLFETWMHQLQKAESGIKMKELVTKINELQRKQKGPKLPRPLGTE